MCYKSKTIEELATISAEAKASGQKVVLAHGVFDVLHVGHKRHLDEGRRNGDLLIVTVTCDEHVNKGPGRPIFTETLRTEMLSALDCVDYVGVSRVPSAENIIEALKPSIYLKGIEYKDEAKDATGRITTERETVERHGGEILYTEDIVFSSSNLSNRLFSVCPPEADEFLAEVRHNYTADDFERPLETIKGSKCLFVGDTIIDEYVYVDPLGKPSKENIISTRYKSTELFCGGVIATVNAASTFCDEIDVVTLFGVADSYEERVRGHLHENATLIPFYRDGAVTTRKSRLVEPGSMRKLTELAYLDDHPMSNDLKEEILQWLGANISNYDMVVVNDFGHGLVEPEMIDLICTKARYLALNVQTNSANRGFNLVTKYPRADLICIDEPEIRLAVSDRFNGLEDVVAELHEHVDVKNIIVTRGRQGCYVAAGGNDAVSMPAFVDESIDTIGAGDAFFSVAATMVGTGCDLFRAAFVGNTVGAMQVRVIGHRESVSKPNLIKYIRTLLK